MVFAGWTTFPGNRAPAVEFQLTRSSPRDRGLCCGTGRCRSARIGHCARQELRCSTCIARQDAFELIKPQHLLRNSVTTSAKSRHDHVERDACAKFKPFSQSNGKI